MSEREITAAELAELLSGPQAPTLIDVRRPDERERAVLGEDSLHIPLDELEDELDELDPAGDYVVYCHHGIRSLSAAAMMQAAGIPRARSLRGGIDAWSKSIDSSIPRY